MINYKWIFFSVTIIQFSFSCTFFNATEGDTTLIGYNEDWSCTTSHVVFYPLANGKYGRAYFGCNNVDFSGVNDRGLFFGEAILTKREISFPTDKPFYPGYIWYAILDSCATVEEAIEMVNRYNIESLEESHFLLVDKSGASAVIEWGKDSLSIIRKQGNYQLMTNFNITDPSLAGWYPCRRYNRADKMLRENNFSIDHFTAILDTVHQEGDDPTQYSVVYDLCNFKMYVYYQYNFEKVKVLDVKKELDEGYHKYSLSSLFNSVGVSPSNKSKCSKQFQVLRISPNQCNGSISIAYKLFNPHSVKLTIYNVIGQEIQTLANGFQQAGSYSVNYAGANKAGGMYIARFQVGQSVQIRKIPF